MITFKILDPRVTPEHLGFIPTFLSDAPWHLSDGAVAQIDRNYQHGGGWRDMKVGDGGWRMIDGGLVLKYPGDIPIHAYAVAELGKEKVFIYESAFVAVVQQDGSFRVARID